MSRPPVVPDTTTAGIAVDPRTLERVIPTSKRPDGSYVPSHFVALARLLTSLKSSEGAKDPAGLHTSGGR
jgi:hypothetical protein